MAYLELYGSGIPDPCADNCWPPTAHPYEIVYYTIKHVKERLEAAGSKAFMLPWIQTYPDGRFNQPLKHEHFVLQQKAAFDAGASGALAWNPALAYDPELFLDLNN